MVTTKFMTAMRW